MRDRGVRLAGLEGREDVAEGPAGRVVEGRSSGEVRVGRLDAVDRGPVHQLDPPAVGGGQDLGDPEEASIAQQRGAGQDERREDEDQPGRDGQETRRAAHEEDQRADEEPADRDRGRDRSLERHRRAQDGNDGHVWTEPGEAAGEERPEVQPGPSGRAGRRASGWWRRGGKRSRAARGRAGPVTASATRAPTRRAGYSQTPLNRTGAAIATNAPPVTPPSDWTR